MKSNIVKENCIGSARRLARSFGTDNLLLLCEDYKIIYSYLIKLGQRIRTRRIINNFPYANKKINLFLSIF